MPCVCACVLSELCMHLCIYMCMCLCLCMLVYVCICISVLSVCARVNVYICTNVYTCVCECACVHVCVCVCVCMVSVCVERNTAWPRDSGGARHRACVSGFLGVGRCACLQASCPRTAALLADWLRPRQSEAPESCGNLVTW